MCVCLREREYFPENAIKCSSKFILIPKTLRILISTVLLRGVYIENWTTELDDGRIDTRDN